MIRDSLFEAAYLNERTESRLNASRLSLVTGLHRKDVSARLAASTSQQIDDDANTRRSVASRVFSRWAHEVRRNSRLKTLPLVSPNVRTKSFHGLAAAVVSDVHPRAVLDELVRLGFASESEGRVTLLTTSFSPRGSADDRLALFSENLQAMLGTGVANVLGERSPQLEYAIATKNISLEEAERISEVAKAQWQTTRDALYKAIVDAPEVSPTAGNAYQIRVGMYSNHLPMT